MAIIKALNKPFTRGKSAFESEAIKFFLAFMNAFNQLLRYIAVGIGYQAFSAARIF